LNAERLPLLVHAVLGTFAGYGEPVELARQPDREIRDVDHLLHFALALGQNLAGLERHQHSEVVLRSTQLVADLAHDFAALRGGEHAPAFEYFSTASGDSIIIIGRGQANPRKFTSVRWVVRGDSGISRDDAEPL
jgi:hypothetical protein